MQALFFFRRAMQEPHLKARSAERLIACGQNRSIE